MKTIFTRRLRLVLIPALAVVMAVVAGSAAYAATSTSGTAKFSVATSVSIAQGGGGTCPGGACDFGQPALSVLSAGQTEDLVINSNDPTGFSLSILSAQANWTESGGGCTPNAGKTVSAGVVNINPAAVTGGTGSGGTANSQTPLTTTAQPFFSVNPTMTGAAIDELLTLKLFPAAGTIPNSPSCAYVIGYTVSIVGL
jgi:hypothetical protein